MKQSSIEWHIKKIMEELDIKETDDNYQTPARIAKMLSLELFKNVNKIPMKCDITLFDNPNKTIDCPVIVKDIKFYSTCEHHWLPFFGLADVEYAPGEKIIGLSKIPRIVKFFSKQPQVQERLTSDIGKFLVESLSPKYLKVTLHDVTHTCVQIRGAEAECKTDTIYEYRRDDRE
jgi:GTP cyclohydrolase I